MKVLFAVSEAIPFAASGGLADVGGSLPHALRNRQQACRVVLPLYDTIAPEYRERMEKIATISVPLGWRQQSATIRRLTEAGVIYYFIENDYYFHRGKLYGEFDDGERFAFFSKAVLEMLDVIDFIPDLIHCNDWQTALIPTFLNVFYREKPGYEKIATLFTIHNVQFQGKYGMDMVGDVLGIPQNYHHLLEYDGSCNLMKAAIEQSNWVSTVSPSYAKELLDPWYGYGMDRILRQYQEKLSGIVNGIDTRLYHPATDPAIPATFSPEQLRGKMICKRELQKGFGLNRDHAPIVSMVTRLTAQKGVDLVRDIFDEMMALPLSFVMLASGDADYEEFFREMQLRYPGRVGVHIGFSPTLSRRVYAGSDAFLMPSAFEPCGLAQMIAMRYGTLPIVRKTGGLRDTVIDVGDEGTGYTFETSSANDLLDALTRMAKDFADEPKLWQKVMMRAMNRDFGWTVSSSEYLALYHKLVPDVK